MLTEAEVPADDDREGQQRLRLPISGADRVCAHTCASSCCVSCFKKGIEMNRTSTFLFSFPFTAVLNWCFLKPALDVQSYWDYVPNTDSSAFIFYVSPSRSVFSPTTSHFSTHLSSLLDILFTLTVFWRTGAHKFSLTSSLLGKENT